MFYAVGDPQIYDEILFTNPNGLRKLGREFFHASLFVKNYYKQTFKHLLTVLSVSIYWHSILFLGEKPMLKSKQDFLEFIEKVEENKIWKDKNNSFTIRNYFYDCSLFTGNITANISMTEDGQTVVSYVRNGEEFYNQIFYVNYEEQVFPVLNTKHEEYVAIVEKDFKSIFGGE